MLRTCSQLAMLRVPILSTIYCSLAALMTLANDVSI